MKKVERTKLDQAIDDPATALKIIMHLECDNARLRGMIDGMNAGIHWLKSEVEFWKKQAEPRARRTK